MATSRHATTRFAQRGIPLQVATLIDQFGVSKPAPGGAIRKFIRKKDIDWIKREAPGCTQLLDKAIGRHLVMTYDESLIITAY